MGVLNNDLPDLDVRLADTKAMAICSIYSSLFNVSWKFGIWPEWAINARYPNGDDNLSEIARFTKYGKMIEQWLTEQVKTLPIEALYDRIIEFVGKLFMESTVDRHKLDVGDSYFIKVNDSQVMTISIYMRAGRA